MQVRIAYRRAAAKALGLDGILDQQRRQSSRWRCSQTRSSRGTDDDDCQELQLHRPPSSCGSTTGKGEGSHRVAILPRRASCGDNLRKRRSARAHKEPRSLVARAWQSGGGGFAFEGVGWLAMCVACVAICGWLAGPRARALSLSLSLFSARSISLFSVLLRLATTSRKARGHPLPLKKNEARVHAAVTRSRLLAKTPKLTVLILHLINTKLTTTDVPVVATHRVKGG